MGADGTFDGRRGASPYPPRPRHRPQGIQLPRHPRQSKLSKIETGALLPSFSLWSMAQFVALDSRPAKAHSAPSREALLARWEAQSRRAESEALSAIPDAALGRRDPDAPPRQPFGIKLDRILAAAVADLQRSKAAFSRYELIRMANRHLPDFLGGLPGGQVTRLLEELAGEALRPGNSAGALCLTAPEMVPVPEAYRRADGLSLWRRHGSEIYTTRAMLDTETRLLRAGAQTGAPGVAPERAAAALGADRARVEARLWRDHGARGAAGAPGGTDDAPIAAQAPLSSAGLADDQAQAAYGVLTSGRATLRGRGSQPPARRTGRPRRRCRGGARALRSRGPELDKGERGPIESGR